MKSKAKNIDLILFDLDGTLVDSRKDITNAVNFTLKKIGLKGKTLEEVTSYIGGGVGNLIRRVVGKNRGNLFGRAVSIFEEYYRKHSTEESRLYPGVADVLEHFKNKRKALVTNRNYEFAVLTLKALGIYDYFENVFGGDNNSCVKPSSCQLDKAISELKADKNETIMVGDMHIDVLAGKNAGITTCAVTYGIGDKEDILKAKPDYVIGDILELKDIIE